MFDYVAEDLFRAHRATYEKFEDGKSKDISDELPFDLPQGWAWCRIRDVTVLRRGEYVTKKLMNPGNIPVILGGQEPAYYCDRSNHDGQCVVISRSGASAGFASYWNQPIFVTDGFLFECPNGISTRFLYHWFKSFPLVKLQRGTGMPHVQSENLNALLFALPPSVEQQRIVEKIEELFAYADAIGELSEEIAKTAQRIDKKILDLAIRGQLVPQDPKDEPASELIKRIETEKRSKARDKTSRAASDRPAYEIEPPFDIPASWEWVKLGDICEYYLGKTPPRAESKYWAPASVHWVSISDMVQYGHISSTRESVSDYARDSKMAGRLSPAGTLLMSFKLTIGRVSILDIPAFHNEAIISIIPYCDEDFLMRDYLFATLPVLVGFVGRSSAIKGDTLNKQSLGEMFIPLPPLAEQKRIVAKIEEVRAMTKSFTT